MVHGFGNIGNRYSTSSYSDNSNSGWNGWLYPVLFIVLPIVAGLMVIVLIACNLYEYYQKKRRLEQYKNYSEQFCPAVITETDKRLDVNRQLVDSNGYNESQFTYNTLIGNYVSNEENRTPVRPMSGWVAPHI